MMTNERETKQTSSSSFPIFKLLLMCLLVVVDLTTWTYPASIWGIKNVTFSSYLDLDLLHSGYLYLYLYGPSLCYYCCLCYCCSCCFDGFS